MLAFSQIQLIGQHHVQGEAISMVSATGAAGGYHIHVHWCWLVVSLA